MEIPWQVMLTLLIIIGALGLGVVRQREQIGRLRARGGKKSFKAAEDKDADSEYIP